MRIDDFAQRLLLGQSIEDKLFFTELDFGSKARPGFVTPDEPGREDVIALVHRGKDRFLPKLNVEVSSDRERGQLLHMFANHELLAVELMALALLKFPDAPEAFRRDLVQTIKDEQKHVKLYIKRMKELGVILGEVPMSASFWKQLRPIESPEQYISCMSLTLEQANLDFATAFETKFRRAGDGRTADVLKQVLRDELFHVGLGVEWMDRWRESPDTQWDFHRKHLLKPLSPAKAKAMDFRPELRRKVGFDEGYINALDQFQRSKGRPPDVWMFNALGERDWWASGPPKQNRMDMEVDMESVLHIVTKADDMLWLRRPWSPQFLEHLRDSGRSFPERREFKEGLGHRHIGSLKPWAWTPKAFELMRPHLKAQTRAEIVLGDRQVLSWRELHHKGFHREIERDLCERLGEDPPEFKILKESDVDHDLFANECFAGVEALVLKSPYGASGDGLRFWRQGEPLPGGWMRKVISSQGQLLVEPSQVRRADFSILGQVRQGCLRWFGRSRQMISAGGKYSGAWLGDDFEGLNEQERRFLLGGTPSRLERQMELLKKSLRQFFLRYNFEGYFGVDTYLSIDASGLKLRPICELNPRMTFGHVALALKRLCYKGSVGVMLCYPKASISWAELELSREHPPFKSGVWALSDFWSAKQSVVLLVMAESKSSLREKLASCLPSYSEGSFGVI